MTRLMAVLGALLLSALAFGSEGNSGAEAPAPGAEASSVKERTFEEMVATAREYVTAHSDTEKEAAWAKGMDEKVTALAAAKALSREAAFRSVSVDWLSQLQRPRSWDIGSWLEFGAKVQLEMCRLVIAAKTYGVVGAKAPGTEAVVPKVAPVKAKTFDDLLAMANEYVTAHSSAEKEAAWSKDMDARVKAFADEKQISLLDAFKSIGADWISRIPQSASRDLKTWDAKSWLEEIRLGLCRLVLLGKKYDVSESEAGKFEPNSFETYKRILQEEPSTWNKKKDE